MPRSLAPLVVTMLMCSFIAMPACSAERSVSVESSQQDTMYFRDGDRELQLGSDSDRYGVTVERSRPASASGLTSGDLITGVGTTTVVDLASLQAALKALDGREANLDVRRGAKSRRVRVPATEYAAWIPPAALAPPSPPVPPRGVAKPAAADGTPDALTATISALDEQVFDAFNRCEDPAQLKRHASHFAEDVEFYHDTGGVTWTRDAMIANTRGNACGNYRRELVAGSLQVFPIKDFGAIEQGVHRFCQVDNGNCDGLADFVILWRQVDDGWRITRVLSYGHRSEPGRPGDRMQDHRPSRR